MKKTLIKFLVLLICLTVILASERNISAAVADNYDTNLATLDVSNWDVSGGTPTFNNGSVSFMTVDGSASLGYYREFVDPDLLSGIDNGNLTLDFSIESNADVLSTQTVISTLNISLGTDSNTVFDNIDSQTIYTTEVSAFDVSNFPVPAGTRFILIELLIEESGTVLDFSANNASLKINDTAVPTLSGNFDSDWTASNVAIDLTATDASGIKGIYDSNDNLLTSNSTYEFNDTSNGTYSFYALDYAGKVSNIKEFTISNIDKEVPTAIEEPLVSTTEWSNTFSTITFNSLVTPSGQSAESYFVSVDGSSFSPFSGYVYTVTEVGAHTFTFKKVDEVLNESPNTVSVTTKFDNLLPVFDNIVLTSTPTTLKYNFAVSDETSGVFLLKYAIGDLDETYFLTAGTDITTIKEFTTNSPAVYTVYLEDSAGNVVLYKTSVDNLLVDFKPITDKSIEEDSILIVELDISDAESSDENLVISFVSDNETVILSGPSYYENNKLYINVSPLENAHGTSNITVTVEDEAGYTTSQSFYVTVTSKNDTPVLTDDSITLDENSFASFNAFNNDTDADLDTLTYVSNTTPSNGVVTFNDGLFTYTPFLFYNDLDSFTYTVSDGTEQVTGTVNLTINNINQTPVTSPVTKNILEDAPVTVDITGQYIVDEDFPYGDILTVEI